MTAEIVPAPRDHDDGGPVPVDPPKPPRNLYATVLARGTSTGARSCRPGRGTGRKPRHSRVDGEVRRARHRQPRHRALLYAARLLWRASAGAAVAVAGLVPTVLDLEGAPLRRAAVQRTSVEDHLKLCRQRRDRCGSWPAPRSPLWWWPSSPLVMFLPAGWVQVLVVAAVVAGLGSSAHRPTSRLPTSPW